MALYYKWDVKNDFAYMLQFFSLISDALSGVGKYLKKNMWLDVWIEALLKNPDYTIINMKRQCDLVSEK